MMNNQQVRVIDPILSTFVRGYTNNEYVGQLLFPNVDVSASGGQVIEFGKEGFMLYATQRAPGSSTARMEFGYLGKPYAVENHGLEALVPDENDRDASVVPGISLSQEAVGLVFDSMQLRLEYQRAMTARNAANYAASNKVALSGATLWSATTSTPKLDVTAGIAAIRASTGKKPNVMILPPMGISKLDRHADVRDRLKFTSSQSVTAQALANYFEVETVVEGNAVYSPDASTLVDVWGNDIVLAYVPTNFRTLRAPSFGYTYQLKGHPNVKQPYRDENRDSWVYGVKHERVPVIAGAGAGYLIQNAF
ncbi:major capsid protein [Herminiimonas arsenitoxidans]|uniref:major capsid protein n=1 Tax=Herminiimonas arsenitoxidans TaxID=1809410 RepID=UPI000970A70D|nr:hypothetical protein [Herminiimonas arsenitoxidans]